MALAPKGIDIRQQGTAVMFRASLKDSTGAKLTTGTTTLTLFELQSDGTLKSYDFNDNTFKTTALTTATLALTHRTGNNSTYNTGVWSVNLATVSGFSVGGIYLAQVTNTGAYPPDQEREFQYGSGEGDFAVSSTGGAKIDLTTAVPTTNTAETVGDALNAARGQGFGRWTISGTTLTIFANDGTTAIRTFTLDSATAPLSRT